MHKLKPFIYTNALTDVLFNLSPKSGTSVEYAKGVLVGVVSTLCRDMEFTSAVEIVRRNLPSDYRHECIPSTWQL